MKKILLINNKSENIINFRRSLIEKLRKEGVQVSAIAFDNEHEQEIKELGVDFYCVSGENRSTNPFKILALPKSYAKIIKQVDPDVVFTFQLKPNTLGVMGAKKAGIKNVYSMVEGAGDAFIKTGFKWKVIRAVVCALYKSAFKNVKKVFFLNRDDKAEFINRKLVKESQAEIVAGIGVDLEKFAFKPLKNDKTFLMIARMLHTKGVMEYCQAARIVRQKYPDAKFNYLGGEGTVTLEHLKEYLDDGTLNYLGVKKDVRPDIEDSTVYVLPSYREGISVSIMEASAVGRAIISTDTVGCRESVVNDYNGYLVPVGDSKALADKMMYFIENFDKAVEMGKNSRLYAEENYDPEKLNQKVFSIINAD